MQWVWRALIFLSIASAVVASITLDTYTAESPKRLFLQHVIRGNDSSNQSAVYAAASSDATPIDVVLQNMSWHTAESNGQEWLVSQTASFIASIVASIAGATAASVPAFTASSVAASSAAAAALLLLWLLVLLLLLLFYCCFYCCLYCCFYCCFCGLVNLTY